MEILRLQVLSPEIFRCVNKVNLVYMQSLFEKDINSNTKMTLK